MQDVKLAKAALSDLPTISQLASKIWNHYYPAIISQAQIDYMLHAMYDLPNLREQTEVKKHQFYLIKLLEKTVGFLSVSQAEPGHWFLHKFYLDQNLAGKNIGSISFRQLLIALEPSVVRLTVNRQNYKAINFYFKCGFKIEKVEDFDIGGGYAMNDFVMVWEKATTV